MMQSTIERLLYITLLLVTIAAGAAFYVIYAQGEQRSILIQNQTKTIAELRRGIAEIKADNKQTAAVLSEQTKRTACLINLIVRAESNNPDDCPPLPPLPEVTSYVETRTVVPVPTPLPNATAASPSPPNGKKKNK